MAYPIITISRPVTQFPHRTRGRGRKYPFKLMEIGQAILVPFQDAPSARVSASRYKYNHPGWEYETWMDDGGIYVRRTA